MAKSFIETIKGDDPIFFINALCGLGDIVSHLTRIPAVEKRYPNHTVVFLLGGFGGSPRLMKEMVERQGYLALIIKNYSRHHQHDNMEKVIKKSYVKESRGDLYETWSFCKEIFNNEEPSFLSYEMAFPYTYNTATKSSDIIEFHRFVNTKTVVIKPFTTEGNPEGFEHDVENKRFWSTEKWIALLEYFTKTCNDPYTPVFVGLKKDFQNVIDICNDKKIPYVDYTDLSIEDTIFVINNSNACVTTNSWEWNIAARSGIPTVCVYLKNHFFLPVHLPQSPHTIWGNLYVETNTEQQDPASCKFIGDITNYLVSYGCRPPVEYSIAMITLNDEDCIRKTMENVMPYVDKVSDRDVAKDKMLIAKDGSVLGQVDNEFIIVDGGSTDKTLDIIKEWDVKVIHNKWDDDFEKQKNFALDKTQKEWRLLIDADEQYDHIFWNQLTWYLAEADIEGVDCINIPRINIVEGLTEELVKSQGWQLSHFGWINYPDYQQRLYKKNCKYIGRTHERIVGSKKTSAIVGQHIIHRKTLARQNRGLEREDSQYKMQAQIVKNNMRISDNKKLVVQCLDDLSNNHLVQKVRDIVKEPNDYFDYAIAYPAHEDITNEPVFANLLGSGNLIKFASVPEFIHILDVIKPYIFHKQSEENTEDNVDWPPSLVPGQKKYESYLIPRALVGTPQDHIELYRSK